MKKNAFRTIIVAVLSVSLFGCWLPVMAEEQTETEEEFARGSRMNPYELGDTIEFTFYDRDEYYKVIWMDLSITLDEVFTQYTLEESYPKVKLSDGDHLLLKGLIETGAANTDDLPVHFPFTVDLLASNLSVIDEARLLDSSSGQVCYEGFSYSAYDILLDFSLLYASEANDGYLRFCYFANEEDVDEVMGIENESYFWIKLPETYEGFEDPMYEETTEALLDMYDDSIDSKSEESVYYVTIASACNFRSVAGYRDANGNDSTISQLPAGTIVELIEDDGKWAQIQVDGIVGFVGSSFLAY